MLWIKQPCPTSTPNSTDAPHTNYAACPNPDVARQNGSGCQMRMVAHDAIMRNGARRVHDHIRPDPAARPNHRIRQHITGRPQFHIRAEMGGRMHQWW